MKSAHTAEPLTTSASGSSRAWWIAIRPATLTAALAPVLVGTATAYAAGEASALVAAVSLFGAVMIQIGTNLANDVCDFEKGGGCICDPMQGSNCALGRCSILKPVGAACTTDINSSSVECVREAVCSNKVCTLRTPVGGACVASECVEGASCQSGTCTAYSVWKKYCSGDFD